MIRKHWRIGALALMAAVAAFAWVGCAPYGYGHGYGHSCNYQSVNGCGNRPQSPGSPALSAPGPTYGGAPC